MKQAVSRAIVPALAFMLAGCAQSACSQPDVLAFVDKARQSRDLYAVGLAGDPVRETPIASGLPARIDPHAALCSAWLLSRNPAYQPGNGQAAFLRQRQDFWVAKLARGYEVGIYRN